MGTSAQNEPAAASGPASLADLTTDEIERVLRSRAEQRRASGQYPGDFAGQAAALVKRTVRAARARPEAVDDELARALVGIDAGAVADVVRLLATRMAELELELFDARALITRVERLEVAERDRGFRPWYSAEAFEARFRGARNALLERIAPLAARFDGAPGPVFDLGCGRGELLEALGGRGIGAYGVDSDDGCVRSCVDRGLHVSVADGVAHLQSLSPGSLGGLAMIQVIEHFSPQGQLDVMAAAARAIAVGGRLVIETVNPLSLYVYGHALYLDPTHTRPVHPLYLQFLAEQAGFTDTEIVFTGWAPTDEQISHDAFPGADPQIITRLNDVLYGPQDYALIATRIGLL